MQARLTQLEEANIALRTDHLRQELACESARSAKESAQNVIDEREKQIAELHEELARRDQIIEDQKREIQQLIETITGRENTEVCHSCSLRQYLWFVVFKPRTRRFPIPLLQIELLDMLVAQSTSRRLF